MNNLLKYINVTIVIEETYYSFKQLNILNKDNMILIGFMKN